MVLYLYYSPQCKLIWIGYNYKKQIIWIPNHLLDVHWYESYASLLHHRTCSRYRSCTISERINIGTIIWKIYSVVIMTPKMDVYLFLIRLQLKSILTATNIFQIIWWRSEGMETIPLMGQIILYCCLIVKFNN